MTQQQKITIDFNHLQEFADKPILRAATFMGLGLNAAYDENFKSYQLTPITQIQILPSKLSDDRISHLKEEFVIWIIAGGLNELIEGFESFLMKIHKILLVINLKNGTVSRQEAKKERKRFSHVGLKGKLSLLSEKYSLTLESTPLLESLAFARNCLTHRHGIVGYEDLKNDESEINIEWMAMDVFVLTPEGEEITIIPSKGRETIELPNGGQVKLRPNVVRSLKFSKGQLIRISPTELSEICLFVRRISKELLQETLAYIKKLGIPVEDTKPVKK